MSVIEVSELYARSGSIGEDWKRTYSRQWQIITDDKRDGPVTVLAALPVRRGNAFESGNDVDVGAYCNSISVSCTGIDGKQWEASAEYGPFDSNVVPANPIERPIDISWGFDQFQRVAERDVDDVAVLNSAGDPYDPPAMIDDSRSVLTITRNESTYNDELAADFKDTVNLDVFWGKAPGTVKVMMISAQIKRDSDIGWYWVVTYQFHINKSGWIQPILDIGMRQLKVGGTAYEPINVNGVPISAPAKLDGEGRALAPGEEPVFLDFTLYEEREFASLNLTLDMIPTNT
jgi:hypothetical protein